MRKFFVIFFSLISVLSYAQDVNYPVVWHIGEPDSSIVFSDTLLHVDDMTIISVCRANDDSSAIYWNLRSSDTTFYALSPKGMFTESVPQHTQPRVDQSIPHIELVRFASHDKNGNSNFVLSPGINSETYELAVFDKHLSTKEALQFMTYLAVKYGITLDLADYLVSDTVLWDAHKDIDYYNRVVGIGRDSVWGLNTLHSRQCANEPTITLIADSVQEKQYAIAGDNCEPLEVTQYDTIDNVLARRWLVHNFGIDALSIAVSPSSIGLDTTEFCMIVFNGNSYSIVLPNSVDSFATFNNIRIDTSFVLSFCGNRLQRRDEREKKQMINSDRISIYIYPNPTHGEFHIDIELKEANPVVVNIFDERGMLVDQQKFDGSDKYYYVGQLTIPQVYMVEIIGKDDRIVENLVVY